MLVVYKGANITYYICILKVRFGLRKGEKRCFLTVFSTAKNKAKTTPKQQLKKGAKRAQKQTGAANGRCGRLSKQEGQTDRKDRKVGRTDRKGKTKK